jgi:solute carrier organic anion transporter family, member 4A
MAPKVLVPSISELPLKYNLFGWGNFRWGGLLSRPWFAYMILCCCTFIQNFSVNGANNAVISTVERAFHLNSVQSGFFLALYDLATVFSAPVIGYLGDFYSSPVFFSFNMIVVAMGNMLIASSHFLLRENRVIFNTGLSQQTYNQQDNVLFPCSGDPMYAGNRTTSTCLKTLESLDGANNAKVLLYLGNFVNGVGSVALFTIGVAYIERIFPRAKAAYCQGIYFAVGTIGGALGIVATGRFLSLYTNLSPKRGLPSWLIPSHPLWIGCWWLPYIVYGLLCFIIGVFVSGLPNFKPAGRKSPAIPSNAIIPTVSADAKLHGGGK